VRQKIGLVLILLAGFFLRAYNMNSPSIGYHSMQENEYLSVAQEMARTQDFVNKRVYFYNAFKENPGLTEFNQPPLIPYQIILSWKALGENLWSARLLNILFGVLSIAVIYLIAKLFFESISLPLYTAFVLAVIPLAVFFSRNIQPESPAFFFMLLGQFFYLKFSRSLRKYNLFLGGIAFSIAWAYRFNFIFGVFAPLFCFPWRTICKSKEKPLEFILMSVLPYFLIPGAIWSFFHLGHWEFTKIDGKCLEIFSLGYWKAYGKAIWFYATGENFTLVFLISAGLGIFAAFFRRKDLLSRYIIGGSFTALLYLIVYSSSIYQNNYLQMPFLAFVSLSSAYAVWVVSLISKAIVKRGLVLLFIIISLGPACPFIYRSIVRLHSTVFLGMDVAGESLREFTAENERVFLYTHAQGNGITRYARRYAGWVDKLVDFKATEQKFNIRYICIYPADFAHALKINNPELFNYIQDNYRVKEVGIIEDPRQIHSQPNIE